ncbi:MAG: hypothetical protein GWO08_19340, partial [Gammaproteobacteria bacterium]|nr:hypothetical protein [Gammaproteobacteria bacterium]
SRVIFVWATVHLTLLLGVSCDHLATTEEQYVNPSQALPMNPQEVKTMAWQGENYLWVGNRAGVGRINRVDGSIEVFDNVACPRLFLTSIGIWCSTVNYINKYDGKTWHRFDLEAYQIIEADDGTLWAGTKEGLAYFDIARQDWKYELKVSRRTSSKFIFKTGSGIQLAFQSSDDALWFYSYSNDYTGVTRWTETSHNTWLPVGDHVMIQPMLETRDGIIWGAGDDGSVSRWDGQQWQVWYPFRLRPAIADIIESQNGDIWVLA